MIKINKIKRIYGFHSDNSGIMTRYQNEVLNWQQHLQNTKSFISASAAGKKNGTCLILGSGWCLDVPVKELAENFDTVILADIIHPRQVEHKYKKYSNVSFLTVDVTQILEPLYFYKSKDKRYHDFENDFNLLQSKDFINDINPDYTVSANILSQLAYFPIQFIKKHHLFNEIEQDKFKELLEKFHLTSLPKGKSVVITDYYEYEYGMNGNLMNEKSRLSIPLEKEKIQKEWYWDFDLSGNYYTGNPVKFKVAALQV